MSKCKYCKKTYNKTRPLQSVCSIECANAHSRKKREAKERREHAQRRKDTRARKEALKTQPQLKREAQTAFNRYIRARDYMKPCISCGAPYAITFRASKFDCGHYRSVGAASHLRYHPLNAAGQCVKCNRDLSGNAVEFRKGLIRRIGQERVEALENDNSVVRYTKDSLRRIKDVYNRRALLREKARR